MRVLIVDTYYPAFLKSHYSRSPELDAEPYAEQWRALMGTFFGVGDAYSHNLAALGHEAHEVVVNCAQLQSAWAREHGLPPATTALRRRHCSRRSATSNRTSSTSRTSIT